MFHQAPPASLTPSVFSVSGKEFASVYRDGRGGENFVILDMRKKEAYDLGHVEGASLNAYLDMDDIVGLCREKASFLVYCGGDSCQKARTLADNLSKLGAAKVYYSSFDFNQNVPEGVPIVKTSK